MEAFLSNTPCFLADDRWLQVMHSAIYSDEVFGDQKDLIFNLWGYLVHGPKLFKETTDIILSPTAPSQPIIEDLVERLMKSRNGLISWLGQARKVSCPRNAVIESCGDSLPLPWPKPESGKLGPSYITQLALRGTYTMCRILKSRLLYALAPSRFHYLELECQNHASTIISRMQNSTKDEGLIGTMFMSQSTWIAKGILETKDAWNDGWEGREGMIEKWKFQAWCSAIGRRPLSR
jgi:hypothetical protein